MPKVAVYKQNGEKTGGEMELKETIFGIEPNEAVVHEAVVMQLASWRQGDSCHKTRARCGGVVDVNPGGKKVLVGPE